MDFKIKGYDSPETRRRDVMTRLGKAHKLAKDALADVFDALLLAEENAEAAIEVGADADLAAAYVAEVRDHLTGLILVFNGHGSPAPHKGFEPNAVEVGGFLLTVVPADDMGPRRRLVITPLETKEEE